jgi:nucleotide-binding universal stress UspA family protein
MSPLPKRVLVPTDFGDAAATALDYAVELATALHAEIVLMHAFEIPRVGFPDATLGMTAELGRRIVDGVREGLDGLLAERKDVGVPIRTCVVEDNPWHAVLAVAEREKADLVVMGTHGRKGLPHMLLGSVAEKVVRTATLPVLIVHHEPAA